MIYLFRVLTIPAIIYRGVSNYTYISIQQHIQYNNLPVLIIYSIMPSSIVVMLYIFHFINLHIYIVLFSIISQLDLFM